MVEFIFLVGVAWLFVIGYISYLLKQREGMLDNFLKLLETHKSLIQKQRNGSTALPDVEYSKKLIDLEAKIDALSGTNEVQKPK